MKHRHTSEQDLQSLLNSMSQQKLKNILFGNVSSINQNIEMITGTLYITGIICILLDGFSGLHHARSRNWYSNSRTEFLKIRQRLLFSVSMAAHFKEDNLDSAY